MKIESLIVWATLLMTAAANVGAVDPSLHELSVPEVLHLAERTSPDLKAALDRERSEIENITILKSFYYPSLDVEAIDSFGFPGSSRDLGISGLMGSPYRSGPAGGVTSNLELLDLGRHYRLQTAREQLRAVQEQTKVVRFQLDQLALQIFLDAARYRGQEEVALNIAKEVDRVEKEVDHFVKTGQRSVVERLLVEDQTTDAQMTASAFHERYGVSLRRLSLVTGVPASSVACPSPEALSEQSLGLSSGSGASPLVARAAADAAAAHENISAYSALNWPKVSATASVGDMDKSRFVSKKDYSGGFGITLPLFEGQRISGEVHRAQALASEKDNDLLAVRIALDDLNARYDETINASRVKLQYLTKEVEVAQQAFKLAKDRYFSFQGSLVDVREALRNLERIEGEIIDVRSDLLLAVGSKALLNGAVPQL